MFGGVTYTDVKTVVIEATGHKYGEPVFVWADDYSAADAKFTCPACGDIQTVSATVAELRAEPSCTEKGLITYTAIVEFEGEMYTDSVSFEIDPKGHSYDCVFEWAEDNKTAIVTFTCAACGDVQTADATVTEETIVVRENGKALDVTVFTASAEWEGTTYTEKKEVVNFMYGDVNGDGKINGQDLIRLRKYLNGENVVLYPGANVNGDSKLNGQDLIRLRKYLSSGDLSLLGGN